MTCGVYKITCTANRKIYIGSSINIEKRWKEHRTDLNTGNHINQRLLHAWNKYGWQSFIFEIVEVCDPIFLVDVEQYWLDRLKASDRRTGFNILSTAYSHLGAKRLPETGQKISAALKAKGIKPSFAGRKHSQESKTKMSVSKRGSKHTPEHTAKVIAGLTGLKRTPEQIERSRLGHLGIKFSKDVRKRMSEGQKKVPRTSRRSNVVGYIATSPSGEIFTVKNLALFCDEHGIVYTSALAVAGGRRNSVYGWSIVKGKRS